MPETRVLIIADNLLTRAGLATLLDAHETLEVIGQVAGDETLLGDIEIYRPTATVIDLGYEPEAMLPRVTLLMESGMPTVILLPDEDSMPMFTPALDNTTAYGLLLRDSDSALIAGALNAVAAGLVTLDPALANRVIESARDVIDTPAESLTPREAEVLQLLAKGMTNKAIALELGISPNTVKFHINAILSKLNAQSRTEAVVRATRLGWIIL